MDNLLAHDVDLKDRTQDVKIDQSVTFSTMLLPNIILEGLHGNGFKIPSPIQLAAIPLARCGLDLIVQAKSGTGKTLVFTITALESIKLGLKRVQVIVLAPTREIALQITDVIRSVGKSMKGLKVQTFVGGKPLPCDKPLLAGCQIAVGCPGRIRHLVEQKMMDPSAVRLLVLDEADKLFDDEYDYNKDINYIFNKCCESKQVMAVSATYPEKLVEFTGRFMRSGQVVTPAGGPVPVLLGLRQFVLITKDHPDYNARISFKEKELLNILATVSFDVCCIFHHYSSRAESMNILLRKKGFSSACLTGKQSMDERLEALEAMKTGKSRILVTTDLTARGIDSPSINLVINMGLPWNSASYLHRMGRAGRYGSQGICISLISEGMELNKFQKLLGKIGGSSMGVNVIPTLRKFDLWSDDLDDFDKLYGIESLEADDESEESAAPPLIEVVKPEILINEVRSESDSNNGGEQRNGNVCQKKSNDDKKSFDFVSLKDLQNELIKYVEKEKTGEKMKKKSKFHSLKGPVNSPVTPIKNFPLSYSQMVSGYRQCKEESDLSSSSSSIETLETMNVSPLKPVRQSPDAERPSCLPRRTLEDSDLCVDYSLTSIERSPRANVALDESRRSKRKRGDADYSSQSSEFESGSYELNTGDDYGDDDVSYSDNTMFTVDEFESASGIDLNVRGSKDLSISDVELDSTMRNITFCNLPRYCCPHSTARNRWHNQTDWYSVISNEINDYVRYCRNFQLTS